MADNEKYLIRLQGKAIEVSKDVYYAYFQMERQERTQEENISATMWSLMMLWIIWNWLVQKDLRIWKLPAWRNWLLQKNYTNGSIMLLIPCPERSVS